MTKENFYEAKNIMDLLEKAESILDILENTKKEIEYSYLSFNYKTIYDSAEQKLNMPIGFNNELHILFIERLKRQIEFLNSQLEQLWKIQFWVK